MNHSLIIGCTKDNLVRIRAFLDLHLREANIPELEIHKMVLAVDEVCANLIIHANNCNASEKLEVDLEVLPSDKVTFIIRDKGVGFDINRYQEPKLQDIVSEKRKGGLGLMLVKRIMDKIEFSTEKNHNICRLIKHL